VVEKVDLERMIFWGKWVWRKGLWEIAGKEWRGRRTDTAEAGKT